MAINQAQRDNQATIKCWASAYNLTSHDGTYWHCSTALVIMADKLRRGVTSLFHNQITAGHPGIAKTLQLLMPYYWWPNMKTFITEYIHGCMTCQINKVNMHPTHPLLAPIMPEENARPFETIAMDFITKLPLYGELCRCKQKHSHTGVLADADSIPMRTSSPPCLSHFVFIILYLSAMLPLCAPIDTATDLPCAFTSCYRSLFNPSSLPSLLSYTQL